MKKIILLFSLSVMIISCVSTRSTLKNVDDSAPDLILTPNNTFDIKLFSTDKKTTPVANKLYKLCNAILEQSKLRLEYLKELTK